MAAPQIKTILVPTDFSEPTREVMEYAILLARTFGAKLILLHVHQTLPLTEAVNWLDMGVPPVAETELWKQLKAAAEKQMARLKEHYQDAGVDLEARVIEGVPFVEIIRFADHEKLDLIVMGSHGLTGVRHLLMGSVAEKVSRKASCPVLVIKPKDFNFEMPGDQKKD
jgi:nucleotide-binding universal stress UspA family protein